MDKASKMKSTTHSNTELNFDLGQPLQEFSKSNLPTGKNVLRWYFYKVKINGNTKKGFFKLCIF